MEIRYPRPVGGHDHGRRRPDPRRPVHHREPEGDDPGRRAGPDAHPAHARPPGPLRRRRGHREADRRADPRHGRDRRRAGREGLRGPRPQLRRDGRVRLGLGEDGPRVALVDHAGRDGQPAGRAADHGRRAARLPPRRHGAVLRPEADRAAGQPREPGARPDRRPLHDGPLRRGDRVRVDRRRRGDPDPLRHLPADRDGRRGVQVRRRERDRVEGRRSWPRARPTPSGDPRDRPDRGRAGGHGLARRARSPASRASPRRGR